MNHFTVSNKMFIVNYPNSVPRKILGFWTSSPYWKSSQLPAEISSYSLKLHVIISKTIRINDSVWDNILLTYPVVSYICFTTSTTQLNIFGAHYPWMNSRPWVGHGNTTDESPGLSMAFRRDIPPYSLEILQWRHADNDPYSNSETLSHRCPQTTTHNVQ